MNDVISGGFLGYFGPLHLASAQTVRWQYFTGVLLETRLKSESFDTLDDLLGFGVQKLRSKVNKIFNLTP